MISDQINDIGEWPIDGANEMNVPVDIWLQKTTDEDQVEGIPNDHKWSLVASNYMPRRGRIEVGAFHATAETRAELVTLIEDYFLPLFEKAVEVIRGIRDDTQSHLYYWEITEKMDKKGR